MIKPTTTKDTNRPGALVMPYAPRPGTTWALHDVLPRQSNEYNAVVARLWHETDGRAFIELEREDGERLVFELWIRRGRQ